MVQLLARDFEKKYACTYMGQWEQQLLDGERFKPVAYLRYLDDIFGIWLHGEEERRAFHDRANTINSQIQVDLRISPSKL